MSGVDDSDSSASTSQYVFDGESYIHTDPLSKVVYKFDTASNSWVIKTEPSPAEPVTAQGVFGFEGDTHTYTDPSDGSMYFWDKERGAWFPKIDEDFLARYQMSYGLPTAPSIEVPNVPKPQSKSGDKKLEAKRKASEPASWFEVDEAHNTSVYVSGLPLDVSPEELAQFFAKCGLIARDEKGGDKIKLYRDSAGLPKGDALCSYIKVESVDLALKILDNSQMRGKTVSVQRAKFQMKGAYDPALKPKRKKKDKERQKKMHEKLFDWRPERMRGEPQKCERVVIIKNLFAPEDFDKEVALLLEYQQDIRTECQKCGDVRKVVLYDRHPEGVAQVTFREPTEAQTCVQLLNGRWFSQRKISAEIWDGKTKYKIIETDAQVEARIEKWDKFLEDGEATKNESNIPERNQQNSDEVQENSEDIPENSRQNQANSEKIENSE